MKIDKYANFVKLTFKSEKEYKDYIDLLEKNLGSYINASNLIKTIEENKIIIEDKLITLIPNDFADIFCCLSYKLATKK